MQQISLKEGMSHIFLLGGYALHTAQSILEATSDEDYTKALNKDARYKCLAHDDFYRPMLHFTVRTTLAKTLI